MNWERVHFENARRDREADIEPDGAFAWREPLDDPRGSGLLDQRSCPRCGKKFAPKALEAHLASHGIVNGLRDGVRVVRRDRSTGAIAPVVMQPRPGEGPSTVSPTFRCASCGALVKGKKMRRHRRKCPGLG